MCVCVYIFLCDLDTSIYISLGLHWMLSRPWQTTGFEPLSLHWEERVLTTAHPCSPSVVESIVKNKTKVYVGSAWESLEFRHIKMNSLERFLPHLIPRANLDFCWNYCITVLSKQTQIHNSLNSIKQQEKCTTVTPPLFWHPNKKQAAAGGEAGQREVKEPPVKILER